jgi:hypothetical protein
VSSNLTLSATFALANLLQNLISSFVFPVSYFHGYANPIELTVMAAANTYMVVLASSSLLHFIRKFIRHTLSELGAGG